MKLNRYLILVCLLCFTFSAYAQQGKLKGSLVDEKGEPLSFANVTLLLSADSTLSDGAVTGIGGNFEIKTPEAGHYFLKASAIGFENIYSSGFEVKTKSFSKDFGQFILKEDVKLLNSVTVESLRPKVVMEADKMVVSVEGTALAAGSTAFEVLAKSPGVWIDQDGNIQLNGKSGVRIMIDGRLTYLSAKELQNMMESMSAENIKDIEIITNPSAKYDAEGSSGIINIRLKKNQLSGINGSVNAGYQFNGIIGYNTGANINIKKGKWNSFTNLNARRSGRVRTSKMYREFNSNESNTYFDQNGREEVVYFVPSLRLGTDYELNDKHSIGAMANLNYTDNYHDFQTDSRLINKQSQLGTRIDANNYTDIENINSTFNLHYQGKLDTVGTTLSADVDYGKLVNQGDADFRNYYENLQDGNKTSDWLTTDNPTSYDIYSARVDFSTKVNQKSKLELGLKASHVVSDNELKFYEITNNNKVLDPSRSNHFIFNEEILAAYTNFSTSFGKTWILQGGLRAEQTYSKGRTPASNTVNKRRYLNLFPSIFLKQNVSENYQIAYNYSRRINRPRYQNLNPFVFYLDPYTVATGNPNLRPEYTNSFQVTQTWKNTFTLVLGYSHTKGMISEVPEQNTANNTTEFKTQNVDDFRNVSATLVAPIKVLDIWDISNNATLAYQHYETALGELSITNKQMFFYLQSTNNIRLPKGVRLELSAQYQSPLAHALYRIESNWGIDLGVKRSFLKKKLDVSFNVTDIFKTRQIVGSANYDGNINTFDQYFSARGLRLNIRYLFNKGEKFKSNKRDVNLDELNRAGG
ncbi:TonB-dependent receptor domain-containing protein [Xanthovirga aplysinae]|uniref:TonB-dependent receptor domain-containing protein n=1 Tax=Xanthovirga aplysinae TaxID=2529853 RepID=UPI0012BB5BE4|nr:TonB-dependent receptor [Xanthovirga aplysinae]MTI33110.1 TonB-dependent receptor [Xanthovirga aplysinae]